MATLNSPMGIMLSAAADSGCFDFETVSYDQFIRFIKRHSPKLRVSIGKRDTKLVTELRRLADVADQEYRAKKPKTISKGEPT